MQEWFVFKLKNKALFLDKNQLELYICRTK